MPKQRTMTVKLPATLSAKVSRLAKERKATRSEIVRDALNVYTGAESLSFSESAAAFCGAAKGPGDLSTNPRYLADFGE